MIGILNFHDMIENLTVYSARLSTARNLLMLLDGMGLLNTPNADRTQDARIYGKAVIDLLLHDKNNIERLLCYCPVRFRNHKRNRKGRLVSAEAYFDTESGKNIIERK